MVDETFEEMIDREVRELWRRLFFGDGPPKELLGILDDDGGDDG